MSLLNIPNELKSVPNWVGWKWEQKKNSRGVKNWTKPPYDLKSNGVLHHADTSNPATWGCFEAAEAECSSIEPKFDGVGFVLPAGLGGVDFDGVLVDEAPEPYVLEILKHLGNPYTEITPSGNGLRSFINATALPVEKGRKFHGKKDGIDKYGAEIYFGSEPGRYLTVTGRKFSGDGISTPPDIDLVQLLMSQIGNEKFKKLWMGDISDYCDDQSVADLALVSMLARLLHNDRARIEKYVGASILGQRDKWTQRKDYRDRTIEKAINGPRRNDPTNSKSSSHELQFHLPAVETGTHRDYVVAPALGQHDGWFPLGAFSIVCGSSGGGKTTLLYQLLLAQAVKARFFGHGTYGRSYLTMGVDRGEDAHKRTLERMHLELTSLPFKPLPVTAWNTDAAQAIVNQIEATSPLPEIVFIEGVDMLVTEGNQIKAVAQFAHELQEIAQHYHLAIIGSAGAPKTKEGHGYAAARDNVLGSTGWARVAETMAVLQFPKGDDASGKRKLTVMLRNAPAEKFTLAFVNGQLEVQPDEEETEGQSDQVSLEIEWFQQQARWAKTDSTKNWFTVVDFEQALHLRHATAERHMQSACSKKYVLRKPGYKRGRGAAAEYHWNPSKTNPLWVAQQKQAAAEQ